MLLHCLLLLLLPLPIPIVGQQQQQKRHSPLIIFFGVIHSTLLLLLSPSSSGTMATTTTIAGNAANDFAHWLPRHVQSEGGLLLLDRRALSEGEVLLFRTKKSRHRAIAVMSGGQPSSSSGPLQQQQQRHFFASSSRFSDALTFKDWLRRVYNTEEDKALKVSIRTTEVIRPVIQHLSATRTHFSAPIIVHANTFQGAGSIQEKPVDVVQFIGSARQFLPDALLSLGWTASENWAAVNRFDWSQAFQLTSLLHGFERQQPIILNMRLNDAVHSVEVLEWLLGIDQPAIYLVLRGDVSDFVDSDSPLRRLVRLRTGIQRRRLLFDVDENWRTRIRRFARKGTRVEEQEISVGLLMNPTRWLNWLFPSSAQPLSTSILSPSGVAFLGWPNSLLFSTNPPTSFLTRQSLTGRIMFLPKQQSREIIPQQRTGMVIYLYEQQQQRLSLLTTDLLLDTPRIPNSIHAFIGYDGRVSLENNNEYYYRKNSDGVTPSYSRIRSSNDANRMLSTTYPKSSTAQLPKWPCYGFWLLDKGWRVEMEVWTERCSATMDTKIMTNGSEGKDSENDADAERSWISHRTFLQLDTPVGRNRWTRGVAIGKSGDGAIDFLARGLKHNNGDSFTYTIQLQWILPSVMLLSASANIILPLLIF